MPFTTDQQTLDDLQMFGRRGGDSIYGIFHRTATRNGAALLEEMFRYPLSDAQAINQRSALFQYFSTIGGGFPFQSDLFDVAEQYLSITDERTRLSEEQQGLGKRLAGLVADDNAYKTVYKGVTALIKIFQDLHRFLASVQASSPYHREKLTILTLFSEESMGQLLKEEGKIPYDRVVVYDSYLRFQHRAQVRRLLSCIYQLDVYFSVGAAGVKRGYVFPRALDAEERRVSLQGIYHPLVKQAIPNSLSVTGDNHILFLTGANMAGKSTFMKTMGIVLFLAHMGFPVPASQVEFSVLDGIFTTINLPDDLGMGVSHFYAEVQRIKKIAQLLHQGKKLFVIFDELFRGTNVKDAYEATIALTTAFSSRRNSVLLLSTHIIEAGEVLAKRGLPIDFIYLPTRMEGTAPVYTYRLEKGITADRHGMVIIENEGIFKILQGRETADAVEFTADQQTLDDLNLTGKYKPGSIYSLFNKTVTEGGERLLEEMFRRPLSDADAINRRSGIFLYVQERGWDFPFTREQLLQVEEYLRMGGSGNPLAATADILRMRGLEAVIKDRRYEQVRMGLGAVVGLINGCREWLAQWEGAGVGPLRPLLDEFRSILDDRRLEAVSMPSSWRQVARYHHLFGVVLSGRLHRLCEILYELDLYIAVSRVASERGFTYAQALPRKDAFFRAEDLRHPGVPAAVGNSFMMNRDSNLIFLTGANMAGKSTLMKSFGIAVYLAHMGFPVAAKSLVFSVKDGLYTSINVADDLNRGHSHFYAEALRVKSAAASIAAGRQLVVIFDELFKGTNVKDAYDATLAVTSAFSEYRDCFFIVSTHIIEVGEELKKSAGLQFVYLPTVMEGEVPRYTYRLQPGITGDRHGMRIIENEGIIGLIQLK